MTPQQEAEQRKIDLVASMTESWKRYVGLFEQPPHGTRQQVLALCELGVFSWLETALLRAERRGRVAGLKVAISLSNQSLFEDGEDRQVEWIAKELRRRATELKQEGKTNG